MFEAPADESLTATVTASDPAGIDYIDPLLYKGPASAPTAYLAAGSAPECTAVSDATTRCTWEFFMSQDLLRTTGAGTWYLHVNATALDGDYHRKAAASLRVLRAAKVTANAAPEPVAKGNPITITGVLSRVNWNDSRYYRYAGQPVRLQFRTPTGHYATVKTVTAGSTGYLRTTVTAARDGYWRYSFAGNTTTGPANAPGDYVDVR
ncbi:DUF5707 domain-containing protein [Streptomyces sp. NPDC053367]|uniref:DUF5707 domain-containing protein n=1 Tax=Streptomyces sp. NPDC053367 TaxID=3365700 RepID=UPI0037D7EB8D